MIVTAMTVRAMTVTAMAFTAIIFTARSVTAMITEFTVAARVVTAKHCRSNYRHSNECHSNDCHSGDCDSNDCHSNAYCTAMIATAVIVTAMIVTARNVTAMLVTAMAVTAMVFTAMADEAKIVTAIALHTLHFTLHTLHSTLLTLLYSHSNDCRSNDCHCTASHSYDCHSSGGNSNETVKTITVTAMSVTARNVAAKRCRSNYRHSNDWHSNDCCHSNNVTAMIVTALIATAMTATALIVTAMTVTAMTVKAMKNELSRSWEKESVRWRAETSWEFQFLKKPRMRALFSHLPLSLFECILAPKLRFHILSFHFLREVSHESFIFTTSTFSFWGKSPTNASFSRHQLSACQGSLAQNMFLRDSGCATCCVLQHKTKRASKDGKVCRATVSKRRLPLKRRFANLKLFVFESSVFEGRLPRKLRFHKLKLQFNCDKLAAMSFCGFCSFLARFIFPLNSQWKSFKLKIVKSYFFRLWHRHPVLEQVLSRRSFCLANVYNSIGFCNLLLTNPIRVAASRCNSVLANSIGVAASMLLCLAVPHVGPWSFATHCLQILLGWLHQCCPMLCCCCARSSMVFCNLLPKVDRERTAN